MKYPICIVSLIFSLGSCHKKEMNVPVNDINSTKDSNTIVAPAFIPYVDSFRGHFSAGLVGDFPRYDDAGISVSHFTPDSIRIEDIYCTNGVHYGVAGNFKVNDSSKYWMSGSKGTLYYSYFIITKDSLFHHSCQHATCFDDGYTDFTGGKIPQIVK